MRVLLTVPSLDRSFGGPAGKARHLRSALETLGAEVRIATVGRHEDRRTLGLPGWGSFRGTPVPRSVGSLRSAVAGADIVHILGYRDPVGTAAAAFARRAGVPYVLEPVGMHRRRIRSQALKAVFDVTLGEVVVRGASAVMATSRLEARELLEDGVPAERVAVRPNGVATGELLPLPPRGELRTRLGIPPSSPLVLALGRITAKKGLAELARAVTDLPGVWLVVAGPDQQDGTLRVLRRMRSTQRQGRRIVLIPGGLWGREKAQAMADADVFALPSITENFGTAAAEGACCGLPVVVSGACGVRDWLDPVASRIVRTGRIGQLRCALQDLLGDPECGPRARAVAPELREQLSWEHLARRQLRVYVSGAQACPGASATTPPDPSGSR